MRAPLGSSNPSAGSGRGGCAERRGAGRGHAHAAAQRPVQRTCRTLATAGAVPAPCVACQWPPTATIIVTGRQHTHAPTSAADAALAHGEADGRCAAHVGGTNGSSAWPPAFTGPFPEPAAACSGGSLCGPLALPLSLRLLLRPLLLGYGIPQDGGDAPVEGRSAGGGPLRCGSASGAAGMRRRRCRRCRRNPSQGPCDALPGCSGSSAEGARAVRRAIGPHAPRSGGGCPARMASARAPCRGRRSCCGGNGSSLRGCTRHLATGVAATDARCHALGSA
jgi:hypothetical protein